MSNNDLERTALFLRSYARSQGAAEHGNDEADALAAARKLVALLSAKGISL